MLILPIDHDTDNRETYLGQIRKKKKKSVEIHFEVLVEFRDDLVQNEQTKKNHNADQNKHHILFRVFSYEDIGNCLKNSRNQKVNLNDSDVSSETVKEDQCER